MIGKVLASAVANAVNNDGMLAEELYVSAAYADEGITMKRFTPARVVAPARSSSARRHITVIVSRMDEERLELHAQRAQCPGGRHAVRVASRHRAVAPTRPRASTSAKPPLRRRPKPRPARRPSSKQAKLPRPPTRSTDETIDDDVTTGADLTAWTTPRVDEMSEDEAAASEADVDDEPAADEQRGRHD